MSSFRAASTATRHVRVQPFFRQLRRETSAASTLSKNNGGHFYPALLGGAAGGSLVFLGGYTYYHFSGFYPYPHNSEKLIFISGAKTLVNAAQQTKQTLKSYGKQLQSSTPDFEPNEAIEWLRSIAKSYAFMIPGASGYIDSAFNDIDAIRQKHGKDVDSIIQEAYGELKDISINQGMTFDTAAKSWEVLQKHLKKIMDLAGDAGQEILSNHPALKEKIGGNLGQLKQMGESYGPEAKKQVDETMKQIQDITMQGMRADSIPKIQSLVQDKVQKVQKLGEQVWEKGMEQAKPLLDKSPQVKQMVEDNTDALKKSGNVQELYGKIKDAVNSGSTDNLRQYVNKVRQGSGGGGLQEYMKMIPGGNQIFPKLTQIRDLAQEHGPEAEKIAKETFKEIEEVLEKKIAKAQELVKKAN